MLPNNSLQLKVNKFTAQLVFFYCIQRFGKHKRKPIPKFIYSKLKKPILGDYCCLKNRIRIFHNSHINCENPVDELVDTVMHEYKHYLHSTSLNKAFEKNNSILEDELESEAIKFAKTESNKFFRLLNL